jgi:hypothetical protein
MRAAEHYAPRYASPFRDIREDLDELRTVGVMSRARQLSAAVGQDLDSSGVPQFFVGDLDARCVLVHLNPKQANSSPQQPATEDGPPSFEDYLDTYRHFGARKYGHSARRGEHTSPFDHKQIRFLRPFDVIDFLDSTRPPDRFVNLERVIDQKLQFELVPYGSKDFSQRGFTRAVLRPHYERIMAVIAAKPRDYVIFCGRVFRPLFEEYIVEVEDHVFHLTTASGTPERQVSRFANLLLPYKGTMIVAGLAQSFARQGIPMDRYGEEVHARYRGQQAQPRRLGR